MHNLLTLNHFSQNNLKLDFLSTKKDLRFKNVNF